MEKLVYLRDIDEYDGYKPNIDLYMVKSENENANYDDFVDLYYSIRDEWYKNSNTIGTSLIEYLQEQLEKKDYVLELFESSNYDIQILDF